MNVTEPAGQEPHDGVSPAAELLERLVSRLGGSVTVSAVYGEPIERQGVTIIPVARVGFGFGGGAGSGRRQNDQNRGGGGGGGASAAPLGYIEIKDGRSTFKPIRRPVLETLLPVVAVLATSAAPRLLRRFRGPSRPGKA
jgi:uncharacterized spore protein YtfJ